MNQKYIYQPNINFALSLILVLSTSCSEVVINRRQHKTDGRKPATAHRAKAKADKALGLNDVGSFEVASKPSSSSETEFCRNCDDDRTLQSIGAISNRYHHNLKAPPKDLLKASIKNLCLNAGYVLKNDATPESALICGSSSIRAFCRLGDISEKDEVYGEKGPFTMGAAFDRAEAYMNLHPDLADNLVFVKQKADLYKKTKDDLGKILWDELNACNNRYKDLVIDGKITKRPRTADDAELIAAVMSPPETATSAVSQILFDRSLNLYLWSVPESINTVTLNIYKTLRFPEQYVSTPWVQEIGKKYIIKENAQLYAAYEKINDQEFKLLGTCYKGIDINTAQGCIDRYTTYKQSPTNDFVPGQDISLLHAKFVHSAKTFNLNGIDYLFYSYRGVGYLFKKNGWKSAGKKEPSHVYTMIRPFYLDPEKKLEDLAVAAADDVQNSQSAYWNAIVFQTTPALVKAIGREFAKDPLGFMVPTYKNLWNLYYGNEIEYDTLVIDALTDGFFVFAAGKFATSFRRGGYSFKNISLADRRALSEASFLSGLADFSSIVYLEGRATATDGADLGRSLMMFGLGYWVGKGAWGDLRSLKQIPVSKSGYTSPGGWGCTSPNVLSKNPSKIVTRIFGKAKQSISFFGIEISESSFESAKRAFSKDFKASHGRLPLLDSPESPEYWEFYEKLPDLLKMETKSRLIYQTQYKNSLRYHIEESGLNYTGLDPQIIRDNEFSEMVRLGLENDGIDIDEELLKQLLYKYEGANFLADFDVQVTNDSAFAGGDRYVISTKDGAFTMTFQRDDRRRDRIIIEYMTVFDPKKPARMDELAFDIAKQTFADLRGEPCRACHFSMPGRLDRHASRTPRLAGTTEIPGADFLDRRRDIFESPTDEQMKELKEIFDGLKLTLENLE